MGKDKVEPKIKVINTNNEDISIKMIDIDEFNEIKKQGYSQGLKDVEKMIDEIVSKFEFPIIAIREGQFYPVKEQLEEVRLSREELRNKLKQSLKELGEKE